jgi:hypothetical protein
MSSITVNSCGPCADIITSSCDSPSDCFACIYRKCEKKVWSLCKGKALERFDYLIKFYTHKLRWAKYNNKYKKNPNTNIVKYYQCVINDLKTRKTACQAKGKNDKCYFTKTELGCGVNCCQERENAYLRFFQNGHARSISKYGNTTKQGKYRTCG